MPSESSNYMRASERAANAESYSDVGVLLTAVTYAVLALSDTIGAATNLLIDAINSLEDAVR